MGGELVPVLGELQPGNAGAVEGGGGVDVAGTRIVAGSTSEAPLGGVAGVGGDAAPSVAAALAGAAARHSGASMRPFGMPATRRPESGATTPLVGEGLVAESAAPRAHNSGPKRPIEYPPAGLGERVASRAPPEPPRKQRETSPPGMPPSWPSPPGQGGGAAQGALPQEVGPGYKLTPRAADPEMVFKEVAARRPPGRRGPGQEPKGTLEEARRTERTGDGEHRVLGTSSRFQGQERERSPRREVAALAEDDARFVSPKADGTVRDERGEKSGRDPRARRY